MKFLTFDALLDKNIHINKFNNYKTINNSIYRTLNNSFMTDLTHTSMCLYKLYKMFYVFQCNKIYVTLINSFKLNDNKFINLLLKLTCHNFFNSKYWIKGIITNKNIIVNIMLLGSWLSKFYNEGRRTCIAPLQITRIKNKIDYICSNLKLKKFSKFIMLLSHGVKSDPYKECLISNKFIMCLCGPGYEIKHTDFNILCNNINEISINFIIKFITAASVNGNTAFLSTK